ncbi:toprim domain-containing protein, partial [Enterococcus faecium]|uniref:toprim domain-containing protein n=1 Tax=Enterococcus faecium TaxID=1352 RepID=UPI003F440198
WKLETLPIIPSDWKLELKASGAKQFKAIKQLLKQATEVVIATDADCEGETIGREVLDACGWRGPVTRLWLSALDDASIRKAL